MRDHSSEVRVGRANGPDDTRANGPPAVASSAAMRSVFAERGGRAGRNVSERPP